MCVCVGGGGVEGGPDGGGRPCMAVGVPLGTRAGRRGSAGSIKFLRRSGKGRAERDVGGGVWGTRETETERERERERESERERE